MGSLLGGLAVGRDLKSAFSVAMEKDAVVRRRPGSLPDLGQRPAPGPR